MKSLSKDDFIKRCISIHGDKYDYSLVDYAKTSDKISIVCRNHGVFYQRGRDHIRGRGCYKCGIDSIKNKQRDTLSIFIDKSVSLHGDLYVYDKSKYINAKTPLIITCRKHGDFSVTPDNHISRNRGCKKCSLERSKNARASALYHKKYANITQPNDYKLIPLSQGQFAKVDNDDFEFLSRYSWNVTFQGYAYNRVLGLMHRLINNTPDNMHTDHINNVRLDNRKSNLRSCTLAQNNRNTRPKHNSSSRFKGVTLVGDKALYQIRKGSINYRGVFDNEVDAAIAYNDKAKELFGEFAFLNTI